MRKGVTPKYKDISKQLIAMAEKERKMSMDHFSRKASLNQSVLSEHLETLKKVIERMGWPTISKVGQEASSAAWLIAQHGDSDVEFQEKCLQLTLDAEPKDIDLQDITFLADRVAVNKGEKQTYGTQFYMNKAEDIIPRPIKNRKDLDARRSKMGLKPFEDYVQEMKPFHDRTRNK